MLMFTKPVLKATFLLMLVVLLQSCVSRSSYRIEVERRIALEQTIRDKNEEIMYLEEAIEDYKKKLNEAEIVSILECRAKLGGCIEAKEAITRTIKEVEEKALYKGMLTVWQSLTIEAVPEVEGRFFKDNYLNFIIKVKDQPVYNYRVKTDNPEGGFSNAFTSLFSITSLFSLLF